MTGQLGTSLSQLGLIELGFPGGATYNEPQSNMISWSQVVIVNIISGQSPSHTLSQSGAAICNTDFQQSATNTYAPSNTATYNATFERSAGNTYSPTSSVTRNTILGVDASNFYAPFEQQVGQDTINASAMNTYSPVGSAGFYRSYSVSNSYNTVTGTATFQHTGTALGLQSFSQSQSLGVQLTLGIHVGNTLTQTGTATAVKSLSVGNTYSPTGMVTEEVGKFFTQVWDVGYALFYNTQLGVSAADYYQPFHTVKVNLIKNESITQNLTQTGSVEFQVPNVGNIYTPTQNVSFTVSHLTGSTYTPTGTVTVNIISSQTPGNFYAPFQDVEFIHVRSLTAPHSYPSWVQVLTVQRIVTLSASNDYAPSQQMNCGAVDTEILAPQTITYSQTAVPQRNHSYSVSNILVQTQSTGPSRQTILTASNVLTFLGTHQVYVPVGNQGWQNIPNLIVTNNTAGRLPNPPTGFMGSNGVPFFAIPSILSVPAYCTLQVPGRAITLPAPEFGDSQAYSGMCTVRRSMTGIYVTYVHRLQTSKLRYEFIMGVPKAWELQSYLLQYNSVVHTLTTWRGEVWYVVITNNPMNLISKSRYSNDRGDIYDDREKISVLLEFEGTRIH